MPCDFLREPGVGRAAHAVLPTAIFSAAGVALALLCAPTFAQDKTGEANKPVILEQPVQRDDAVTSEKGDSPGATTSTGTVTTGNNSLPAVTDAGRTDNVVGGTADPGKMNATASDVEDGNSGQAVPAESLATTQPAAAATDGGMGTDAGMATPVEMPSLLDDPAGALRQILAQPERRSDLPHDLSPWSMFMNADIVVKAVMTGLAFASLVTWTVWLAKMIELTGARARVGRTLRFIRSARTLEEAVQRAQGRGGPAVLMLRAAKEEAELSDAAIDHAGGSGLKERVSSSLGRIEAFAGRRISKGTGLLATIGSTAPFVGLFGTVWGIMNSFIGISEAQTTNLAVVAPGIAEALLATAIGLVAAIPAVIIYNVFARSITGYRQLLADAATGVERLVSRDLDFRKVPAPKDAKEPAGSLHAVSAGRAAE